MPIAASIDTTAAIAWYRRNRARTEAIFDLIDPVAYYSRPIALRNPIVFYEGHLPAFSVIAFLRRGLRLPPVDARLEKLFERGIDPDSEEGAVPRSGAQTVWPTRDEVRAFARACDEAVIRAMESLPAFDSLPLAEATPALEGLYTALEHEAMHQETLLYMWHRLPYEQKRAGVWMSEVGGRSRGDAVALAEMAPSVGIPAGMTRLGADRQTTVFGWDNEFDAHDVHVPAFDTDVLPVTNVQFLEFIAAGGYQNRALWDDEGWAWVTTENIRHPAFWIPSQEFKSSGESLNTNSPGLLVSCESFKWRGMFEAFPLPEECPVYVSQAEACAYARWKGRRLMTEPEFHRAAEGATAGHVDFAGFDPTPAGSHPQTASRWGVHDLIGNGWEWTSTVFAPFDGFEPMRSYPEYSADFFDGRHYVMKGGSQATAIELTRPSFRNWFRGNYPYVYAKFRTVEDRGSRIDDRGSKAGVP